jgi:hypothetical protein
MIKCCKKQAVYQTIESTESTITSLNNAQENTISFGRIMAEVNLQKDTDKAIVLSFLRTDKDSFSIQDTEAAMRESIKSADYFQDTFYDQAII